MERDYSNDYPTYLDIGHNMYYSLPEKENCKSFVWIFTDGKLEVIQIDLFRQKHSTTFDLMSNWLYAGRAEQCKDKTKISLYCRSEINKNRDIPNTLLSQLYDRFGINSEIYVT